MTITETELKDIFVTHNGIITSDEFDRAAKAAADMRRPLVQSILEHSLVSPRYFLELLGEYFGVPVTELKIADIDVSALSFISESFAIEHMAIPFAKEGDVLKVAMAYPKDPELIAMLERTSHLKIIAHVATERAIRRAMVLYRGSVHEIISRLLSGILQVAPKDAAVPQDAPSVVALLDAFIDTALLAEASDIHFEPFENEILARFRVDGLLRTVTSVPKSFHAGLIARLKVLGSMRIDERRLPQDGRFTVRLKDQSVDIRLSVVPSFWGEKAVLRILQKDAGMFDLGSLGLLTWDLNLISKHLERPFGMILVCGPTGSGKTTTEYSLLQKIGTERIDVVNISTIEDPIEYTVPRITQIQIQPDIDLTFASGLRSLLRQDPDIIMVGEIRDNDTADIAARAALVGRLLLASLHTNDAIGAIPRLLDMGVEPYIVSSTLTLVVAQRLIRKLCTRCRESYEADATAIALIKDHCDVDHASEVLRKTGILGEGKGLLEHLRLFRAGGCDYCDHIGYQGRTGVFEVMEINDAMRSLIATRTDVVMLKKNLETEGMKTLFIDGLAKAIIGVTDLNEVMRVTV